MDIDRGVFLLFLLFALMIGVAYYVGLATDINAASNAAVKIGNLLAGRNSSGNYPAYPTGGGPIQ